MGIHHAYKRRPLSREILKPQERNPGQFFRAHGCFYLLPVSNAGKLPRCLHIPFPHRGKPQHVRFFLDYTEICRIRNSLESGQLLKIRKYLKLSHLKAEYRLLECLPQFLHRSVIISSGIGVLIINISADTPGLLLRLCFSCKGPAQRRFKIGLGCIEVAVRITANSSIMYVGPVRVQPRAVQSARLLQHTAHPLTPRLAGTQFIAKGKHNKRGMIGQPADRQGKLLLVIGKALPGLKGVIGIPVGQFRLHHHTEPVSRRKRRFRWAVRVETDAVNSISLVSIQNVRPFIFRHRRISGFREFRAVCLASQENGSPIKSESSLSIIPEVPHTEGHPFFFISCQQCRQFI